MLVRKVDILEGLDPVVLDGVMLAFSEQVKILRVVMDPALHFEKQVGLVARSTFC